MFKKWLTKARWDWIQQIWQLLKVAWKPIKPSRFPYDKKFQTNKYNCATGTSINRLIWFCRINFTRIYTVQSRQFIQSDENKVKIEFWYKYWVLAMSVSTSFISGLPYMKSTCRYRTYVSSNIHHNSYKSYLNKLPKSMTKLLLMMTMMNNFYLFSILVITHSDNVEKNWEEMFQLICFVPYNHHWFTITELWWLVINRRVSWQIGCSVPYQFFAMWCCVMLWNSII